MISDKEKRGIFVFIWVVLFVLSIIFGPLSFGEKLKAASKEMTMQKKSLDTLELRIGDFHNFQKGYLAFKPMMEKINSLFIRFDAPISFIEFLEHEAALSNLRINIHPASAGRGEPWKSMGFSVSVGGYFSEVQRFLQRIENGPWLVDIPQVSVERVGERGHQGWQSASLGNLQASQVSASITLRAFSPELLSGNKK